jgi:solute carrier family 13 (sodium-dependent dicarboxylate transporter), member 2/3/5
MTIKNPITLVAGFLASVIAYYVCVYFGLEQKAALTLAITLLTAIYWMTEALPIPVSSLIPFVAFPIAGVLPDKMAASALGSHVILLLMGAFMLSKAIEKSGVHRRLALNMIHLIGNNNGKKIVFSFMLSAAFLSMWISNTATVLALLPVAMALIQATDNPKFSVALLLGLAYSASLAGAGTLIGTPPNVIFSAVYSEFTGKEYGFLQWMKTGVPLILISIPIMALWLTRSVKLEHPITLPKIGAWRSGEIRTLMVFGLVAFLWVFRKEPEGGISELFELSMIGDSTIALFGVLLMFIVPSGNKDEKNSKLLDWDTAVDIPWGMLLLFAGGICIAKAFIESGLSDLIGQQLVGLNALPVFLMIFLLALSVSFLTEITSNTATANLLLPILASAAVANNIPPEILMIPAVISCSCAFCLPVATAPNSIIFASNQVTIKQMAHEGIRLNFIVAFCVALVCTWSL